MTLGINACVIIKHIIIKYKGFIVICLSNKGKEPEDKHLCESGDNKNTLELNSVKYQPSDKSYIYI